MYEDETKCGDIWYCNQRHLTYAYSLRLESFIPDYLPPRDVDKELDEFAKQKVVTFYLHPHMAVCKYPWDLVFMRGNKYPFGEWPYAEARNAADTAVFYERFRAFIRKLKADDRFEITDCERLYADQKPRRPIRPGDIPAIRSSLLRSLGPVRSPGEWSIADVFGAATAFLKGEDSFIPGKTYGFLYAPKGVKERRVVKAADVRRAAAALKTDGFLPVSIDVGGVEIGPADFLFAALEVLETGAGEVAVEPRDQLGEISRYLPKMADVNFRGTWIYTEDYTDKWTSNRLRWQFWTFRYE
jgi:hypothetical protein